MNSIRKLLTLVISVAFLATLTSYPVDVYHSSFDAAFKTELVISSDPDTAASAFNITTNALPEEWVLAYLNANFTCLLSAYNTSCDIKYKVQNGLFLNYKNYNLLIELKSINALDTDNYTHVG